MALPNLDTCHSYQPLPGTLNTVRNNHPRLPASHCVVTYPLPLKRPANGGLAILPNPCRFGLFLAFPSRSQSPILLPSSSSRHNSTLPPLEPLVHQRISNRIFAIRPDIFVRLKPTVILSFAADHLRNLPFPTPFRGIRPVNGNKHHHDA